MEQRKGNDPLVLEGAKIDREFGYGISIGKIRTMQRQMGAPRGQTWPHSTGDECGDWRTIEPIKHPESFAAPILLATAAEGISDERAMARDPEQALWPAAEQGPFGWEGSCFFWPNIYSQDDCAMQTELKP